MNVLKRKAKKENLIEEMVMFYIFSYTKTEEVTCSPSFHFSYGKTNYGLMVKPSFN